MRDIPKKLLNLFPYSPNIAPGPCGGEQAASYNHVLGPNITASTCLQLYFCDEIEIEF